MAAKPNLNQTHLKPIFDMLDVLCEQEIKALDNTVLKQKIKALSDARKIQLDDSIKLMNDKLNKLIEEYNTLTSSNPELTSFYGNFNNQFYSTTIHLNYQSMGIGHYDSFWGYVSKQEADLMAKEHYAKIDNIRDFYSKLKGNIVITDNLDKIKSLLLDAGIDISLLCGGISSNIPTKRVTLDSEDISLNDNYDEDGDLIDPTADDPIMEDERSNERLEHNVYKEIEEHNATLTNLPEQSVNPVFGLPNPLMETVSKPKLIGFKLPGK